MSVTTQITFRYLRSMMAKRAVFAMTLITVIGIAISVSALVVSVSFADGFGRAYRKAITDFSAHAALLSVGEIENADSVIQKLEETEDIVSIVPFLYREGLIIYKGKLRGVVMKGAGPAQYDGLKVERAGGTLSKTPIILGAALAKDLGVSPGGEVRIMLAPDGSRFGQFSVAGVFESGMYDFDSQFAILDLKKAQELFGAPDTITGVEIKIGDPESAPQFAQGLEGKFDYPLYAVDWQDLNKSLFDAVKLEKIMFAVIMGALVLVAVFNIIGTVSLKIFYKTHDISILRAIGLRGGVVRDIFSAGGFLTGVAGVIAGDLFACFFIWTIERFKWIKIPEEIYLVDSLPVCISWPTVVMVSAFTLFVCYAVSLIAADRAVRLPIVEGL